jgi:hypothetical protein
MGPLRSTHQMNIVNVFSTFVWLSIAGWAVEPNPDEAKHSSPAGFRPDELRLTLKIQLTLVTENISQKPQRLGGYSVPKLPYWVEIKDEAGHILNLERYFFESDHIQIPGNASRRLDPGQKIAHEIELGQFISVPKSGRYHLRAWRFPLLYHRWGLEAARRSGKPLNMKGGIESNEVTLEIVPLPEPP